MSLLFRDADSKQYLTEDLVRRLLNRTGHGVSVQRTPHALAEHGPDADLAARYVSTGNGPPTNTGFTHPGEMIRTTHEAIRADPTGSFLRDAGMRTREIFNVDLTGTDQTIYINYATRVGGSGTAEEFSGVVRVIVDRREGQLPDIVTAYPVM